MQACTRHCIRFEQDTEGFFYPEVDTHLCINCGQCDKVCPDIFPYNEHKPIEVLAAFNKNEKVRIESSSGGIFTLLAEKAIDSNGVVFGVRFDEHWQVVFDYAETKDQLTAFRGSKYLQARVGDSFKQCKRMLETGRQVLFSGTPCQIAGLNHFLGKNYPNLLAVDIVCHGVPSPKVWTQYLKEIAKDGINSISDIQFRNKRRGWKGFSLCIKYKKHDKTIVNSTPYYDDLFMRAFLSNLILRPSCYSCPAKGGRSHSDITIADFWGIDKINPQMDDNLGTSLVLIHTEKGYDALRREEMIYSQAKYEDVFHNNTPEHMSVSMHPQRDKFFNAFTDDANIHRLITYCLRPTTKQRVKRIIRHPIAVAKGMITKVIKACHS